jgi:hypothetical protein
MLCEAKSLLEEWFVRRVAADDPIQGDCACGSQFIAHVNKVTMHELDRLRPATPGCLL